MKSYCLKCKKKTLSSDEKYKVIKGKNQCISKCEECGSKKSLFLPKNFKEPI